MLEVKGLCGGYGDITVLRDVELSVGSEQVTTVLGRNGAGKTSLLDAVAGLLPDVTGGQIVLEGSDVTGMPTPRRISRGLAYVQENKQIFRQRTVEENLLIGGFLLEGRRLRNPRRRAALEAAYDRFPQLGDRRDQLAGGLSGGQQQMLAIAQALMPEPRLLMLDEPSAGLAPSIAAEVFALISRVAASDLSVLLVEQVVEEAMAVSDRIVVLESGRVAASGPVDQFEDSSVVAEIYLGNNTEPSGVDTAVGSSGIDREDEA